MTPVQAWSADADGVVLRLGDLGVTTKLDRFISDWRAEGLLVGDELRFSSAQWKSLGVPSVATDSEEEEHWIAEWACLHDALTEALGLGGQAVSLELVGFFGAKGARIRCSVEGVELSPLSCDGVSIIEGRRGRRLLSPFVAWLWDRLAAAPANDRLGQLRIWAEVRQAIDAHLPTLAGRPGVTMDAALSSISPRVVNRFALEWEPAGPRKDLVTLKVSALSDDGTRDEVALDHFDERGIVAKDAKSPLLLPDDVSKVFAVVGKRRLRSPKDLGEELTNPAALIPEGVEADKYFDLSGYSERVAGFELVVRKDKPIVSAGSGTDWFGHEKRSKVPYLELLVDTGSAEGVQKLALESEQQAKDLLQAAEAAIANGSAEPVPVGNLRVPPTETVVAQLKSALGMLEKGPEHAMPPEAKGVYAAVVKELEAGTDADGIVVDESSVEWEELTRLLKDGIELKVHQRRGIAWMLGHLRAKTPGVLLADDMGLGKTLQASAFLALRSAEQPEARHLIVCPTVLLDNWVAEIAKFFKEGVLDDILVLHDAGVRRAADKDGALDLKFLSTFRLILTNYETLARYQRSLLRLDFDIVVFDEAQQVKNEDTIKARGARALKRNFALAMTGTPVENVLTDVWALYDAAQTGQPRAFGNKDEFIREYTNRGRDGINAVRNRLKYPSPHSSLLRREKAEALRDLPTKTLVSRRIEMTPRQVDQELAIARSVSKRGALAALDGLRKLYQHPALLESQAVQMKPEEALKASPKTRLCLDILEEIRSKGEKALVFTLWQQMQDVLVDLIKFRFGLPTVSIINGDPRNRKGAQQKISAFSKTEGFDVMILSPIAAGVGLTITEANHVIHYGRWWNPAKEDQATDRAYRIGQTKPVTVYYPVLHRPGQPEKGFDVRLHELVERKRAIARDFLAPMSDVEPSEGEFKKMFLEDAA